MLDLVTGNHHGPGPGAARSPARRRRPVTDYVMTAPSATGVRDVSENANTPPKGQPALTRRWHHGGVLCD